MQTLDLVIFTLVIGRREARTRLQHAHLRRVFEAFRQQGDHGRIDIVDRLAQRGDFRHGVGDLRIALRGTCIDDGFGFVFFFWPKPVVFAIAHAYKTTARMSLGEVPLQHNRGFRAHRHRLMNDIQQILKLAWRGRAHRQHVAGRTGNGIA